MSSRKLRSTKGSDKVGLLTEKLRALLVKNSSRKWQLEELSDHFDVSIKRIREAIDELEKIHTEVHVLNDRISIRNDIERSEPTIIDTSRFEGKQFLFGVTADNHLASMYYRADITEALFDIWESQGVKVVLQCGNMIDGEARFNKYDLLVHGVDAQVDYFVEHWPRRKGIETWFISGDDHEGWYTQREGLNVGRLIESKAKEAGRRDLKFLGHMEHDLILQAKHGSSVMRLIHAGGGTAYAISYTAQKIVESYQGGEKPQILLIGHYHKFDYSYPRGVHAVQVGCTEDQTPFMRKKKLEAMLGGVTIRFTQSIDGLIHGFSAEWHPFYDRNFYESDVWKYQWPKISHGMPMLP